MKPFIIKKNANKIFPNKFSDFLKFRFQNLIQTAKLIFFSIKKRSVIQTTNKGST